MKIIPCLFCFCATFALLLGCSKQSEQKTSTFIPTQQASVITLASNERGRPQFDYSGPDNLSYKYSLETFSYQVGPVGGSPWMSAKGEMKFSDTNHVTVTIQSSSDRPYDIELLGLWTNRSLEIAEDKAREILHVPAGEQKLNIDRFVIWTYDFAKEK